MARTRNDPRKAATRTAIIEVAEALFAQHGIDGVSLRQIGAATGSANTSVVAYHFGSREALVEAIFHYRLPALENRRSALLDEVRAGGREHHVPDLLHALWWPLYEQTDARGMHSYAGFMAAFMYSSLGEIRLAITPEYPVSDELGALLRACTPDLHKRHFDNRLRTITQMVTGALKLIDQSAARSAGEHIFKDTLLMASAALLAAQGDEH